MEKPILRQETFSKSTTQCNNVASNNKAMLYDSSHICKTYNKDFYTREFFLNTACPACGSIGRFNLHGFYRRYVVYFKERRLIHKQIDIKRVMCRSCKTTHAVLPIDIIAYRLLSLFVFLFVLFSFYLKKTPVLALADKFGFSFQFIYSVLHSFWKHMDLIHLFFRMAVPAQAPLTPSPTKLLKLIGAFKPRMKFQYDYISENKRPCFMCKFFDGSRGPPVGRIPL